MGDSVTKKAGQEWAERVEGWKNRHKEVYEDTRLEEVIVGLTGIDPDRKQGPEIDEHKVRDWMRRMLEEEDDGVIDGGVVVSSGSGTDENEDDVDDEF